MTLRSRLLLPITALAAAPWIGMVVVRQDPVRDLQAASSEVGGAASPAAALLEMPLTVFAVLFLLTLLAFYLVMRRVTTPLKQLTQAAEEVAHGNFHPELPEGGTPEVVELTEAFGTMLSAVHGAVSQVEASRQMATVGEFASQLSHEIRNPLTSVKLNLQTLEREVKRGAISKDFEQPVRVALREISRLDTVAGSVLRLGRPQTLVEETCSARELCEGALEVLHLQLAEQRIRVRTEFRAREDLVRVDPEQVTAVFLNLLLNATQAMPEGGVIHIRSYGTNETETGEPAVRIHIADEGPGIPEKVRYRLFEPFFTTKKKGSGLGLPTALRTIEDHGGRLFLAEPSDVRRTGAEFVVELPLVDPQLCWLEAAETKDIAPPRVPFVEERPTSMRRSADGG